MPISSGYRARAVRYASDPFQCDADWRPRSTRRSVPVSEKRILSRIKSDCALDGEPGLAGSYRLVVEASAFSRASQRCVLAREGSGCCDTYDGYFQTPAFENLLWSSPAVEALSDEVIRLQFRVTGKFSRPDCEGALGWCGGASFFSRQMGTGGRRRDDKHRVGFRSHSLARPTRRGAQVDMPTEAGVGILSFPDLRGSAKTITGGLSGRETAAELESRSGRHYQDSGTHRGRVSYRFVPSGWLALAASYGSGLPFEDFDDDPDEAAEQFGPRVVDRVNFATGRVRPNMSLDASLGMVVARTEKRSLRVQAEVRNLTNRLDVINFAGLFSGTALAAPRSIAIRLHADF